MNVNMTDDIIAGRYSTRLDVFNLPEQAGMAVIGNTVLEGQDRSNVTPNFTMPSNPYVGVELTSVSPSLPVDRNLNNTIRFVDYIIKKRIKTTDINQTAIRDLRTTITRNLELFKYNSVNNEELEERLIQLYSFISLRYCYKKLNKKQRTIFDKSMKEKTFFKN